MTNKKLFKSAVIITAVMLSVSGCAGGCSKQTEPVIADATVETPEPEESIETKEPTPSPTVEPTEEPVEESSESEVDTPETEENTENTSESTGIEIVEELDLQMYVQTSANARSGDGTEFEVVTTFSVNTELHVTGRTANDWYRIEQSEGDVYISGKLLGTEKAVIQQQSTGGNNQQTNDNMQQPPAQTQQPQQPSGGGQSGEETPNNVGDSLGTTTNGNEVIVGGSFDGLGDL